jgi:hypothetical protein
MRSVLVFIELVRIANVERVLGILANPPLPGRAPLIEDTQRSSVLTVCDVIVLACMELVKKANVDKLEGMLVNRPRNPYAVDNDEIASCTEDVSESVETYPAVPRPWTVEARFGPSPIPKTVDVILEASSVGSTKLLIYSWRP